MLKKQRNELFNIIKNLDLDINDFTIAEFEEESSIRTTITYKAYQEIPFYFVIRNPKDSYENLDCQYTEFSPSFFLTSRIPRDDWSDFSWLKSTFEGWINNHVKGFLDEQNEIDLWTEYKAGEKIINLEKIDFNDQSEFSVTERNEIASSLNELKLLIQSTFQTTREQQAIVGDKIDYLIEASKRLNKYDWKGTVVNTLITISVTLSLDAQKGQILFELFKKAFSVIPQIISR